MCIGPRIVVCGPDPGVHAPDRYCSNNVENGRDGHDVLPHRGTAKVKSQSREWTGIIVISLQ